MSHTCHANGCNWATERRLLMCLPHWTKVPSDLQAAVWKAYRAQPNPTQRARDIAYMTACADAVEFVARLEGRPEANSYRRVVQLLQHQAAHQLPQMTAGLEAMLSKAPSPARVARA